MTIERTDIEKLAELARIDITEQNITATARSISEILALVDQLQAARTENVEPMAHPLDATQRLRADRVTEPDRREDFLALAPCSENGLYLVPQVLD